VAKNDDKKDNIVRDIADVDHISSINPNVSVTAKPGESAESLLRRFRYKVKESGILEKLEEIRFYQRPSQRRKQEEKLRQQRIARSQRFE